MAEPNRYASARAAIARPSRRRAQQAFRRAWQRPAEAVFSRAPDLVELNVGGATLCCLCSVIDTGDERGREEHLSVSVLGSQDVPSWDQLVLARALAWSDDALVVQVFPPLTGPCAEPWVNVAGAEVLHLCRFTDGVPHG